MIPIFGVNKDNKKNQMDHSGIFVTAKVSDALLEEYNAVCEQVLDREDEEQDRSRSVKRWERSFCSGAIVAAACLILTLVTGQFNAMLQDTPWTLIIALAYLVIFGIYMLCTRVIRKKRTDGADAVKSKPVENEEDHSSDGDDPRIKEIEDRIYASLGVPASAKAMDVLLFDYKTVDGAPVPQKSMKRVSFFNNEMRIFKDGSSFCLSDMDVRYEFPLAGVGTVKTVRGDFSLLLWSKSTPFDEGAYRLYGMKKDALDNVLFSIYHILELEKDGETYGLYFPCYELPVVQEILDVSVE